MAPKWMKWSKRLWLDVSCCRGDWVLGEIPKSSFSWAHSKRSPSSATVSRSILKPPTRLYTNQSKLQAKINPFGHQADLSNNGSSSVHSFVLPVYPITCSLTGSLSLIIYTSHLSPPSSFFGLDRFFLPTAPMLFHCPWWASCNEEWAGWRASSRIRVSGSLLPKTEKNGRQGPWNESQLPKMVARNSTTPQKDAENMWKICGNGRKIL